MLLMLRWHNSHTYLVNTIYPRIKLLVFLFVAAMKIHKVQKSGNKRTDEYESFRNEISGSIIMNDYFLPINLQKS